MLCCYGVTPSVVGIASLRLGAEVGYLGIGERAPLAGGEGGIQLDAAEAEAGELGDLVGAGGGNHTLYLVVFALGEGNQAAHTVGIADKSRALTLIAVGEGGAVFKIFLASCSHEG